jgi:hypothetical protein
MCSVVLKVISQRKSTKYKFFCYFIGFFCELTDKKTEHTVASYVSSDFA